MQVVKAFNQEKKENKRFREKNVDVTDEFNNVHLSWTAFWPKLMGGLQLIFLAVWFIAIPRMISDQPTLSMGVFISFILYMTMFAQPIEVIGQVARMLNRALSSAYRIFEILDTNPTFTLKVAPDYQRFIILLDVSGSMTELGSSNEVRYIN